MSKICVFYVSSGAELLGELIEGHPSEKEGVYALRRPIQLGLGQNAQGQPTTIIRPFALYNADDIVFLSAAHVVSIINPVPEVCDIWRRATSPIIQPPAISQNEVGKVAKILGARE